MSDTTEGYAVVPNIQRDPATGRVVACSYWVCGPAGFLVGPLDELDARALADRLNRDDPTSPPP